MLAKRERKLGRDYELLRSCAKANRYLAKVYERTIQTLSDERQNAIRRRDYQVASDLGFSIDLLRRERARRIDEADEADIEADKMLQK